MTRHWSDFVEVDMETGCLVWTGSFRGNGYGHWRGRNAHRSVYIEERGPIPDGLYACHCCDNRACVNPNHIFIGTCGDNLRDMAAKGRQVFQQHPERAPRGDRNGSRTHPEARPRGEGQWQAKLTDAVVAAMRATARCGSFNSGDWSRWLGLSPSTVKRAINGRTWAHVVLLVLAVVSLDAFAQVRFPRCRSGAGRSDRGFSCDPGYGFFEFAPASGAGLGAPCACAAVTGAKGEAVTWTRGSSAMCTKSASETSIANGDLVLCGNNLPRVMSLVGPLGVLVESSRTNNLIQSQSIDNAAWTPLGAGGSAAPTVTADFAVAPDGTSTAERVQVSACATLTQASVVFQNYTGTAAATSGTLYVKGNAGTSGSISVYYFDTTATTGNAAQCAFNGTTWTRCGAGGNPALLKTFVNTTHRFGLGCINDAAITGSTNTGAVDVLVWGGDSEPGTYATSYIPTAGSAAMRSEDTDGTTKPSFVPGSVAATTLAAPTASGVIFAVGSATDGVYGQWQNATTQFGCVYKVAGVAKSSVVTGTINAKPLTNRVSCSYDGTNVTACLNGTCTAAAFAFTPAATTATEFGNYYSAGFALDGIVSTYCEDPSPSRCR